MIMPCISLKSNTIYWKSMAANKIRKLYSFSLFTTDCLCFLSNKLKEIVHTFSGLICPRLCLWQNFTDWPNVPVSKLSTGPQTSTTVQPPCAATCIEQPLFTKYQNFLSQVNNFLCQRAGIVSFVNVRYIVPVVAAQGECVEQLICNC